MDTRARSTQQNTSDPASGYARDDSSTFSGLSGVRAIDGAKEASRDEKKDSFLKRMFRKSKDDKKGEGDYIG